MQNDQVSLSMTLAIMTIAGVVLLPWITIAVSELLLARYRRVVLQCMGGSKQRPTESSAPASPDSASTRTVPELNVETYDHPANNALSGCGDALYLELTHTTRRLTGVYVTAGLTYAVAMGFALALR